MPWIQRISSVNPEITAVYSGTAVISNGTSSENVSITTVTKNKTFLIFSYESSIAIDDSDEACVRGILTDGDNLDFDTGANVTGDINISWFLIEFSATSSASVQHGLLTYASDPDDITISAVTLANSFPIISHRNFSANINERNFFSLEFTSTTNLRVANANPADAQEIAWQVVEYSGWDVTRYTDTMAIGDNLEDTPITAVVLAETFLIGSSNISAGNVEGDSLIRSFFNSTTVIRSDCQSAAGTDEVWNLEYWVVEGNGTFDAQHIQDSTPGATEDVGLSPDIDPAKSIVFPVGGMHNNTQGQDNDTIRDFDVVWPALSIKDLNEITLDRGSNYNTMYWSAEVIDFSPSM
jgi:hypothetical protein